jgi:cation transport protein ChaC
MTKEIPSFRTHGKITRADVQNGLLEEMISDAEQKGYFRRLPESERDKSRWNILSQLPNDQDVWLYAYGSLIWSPMIKYSEKKHARLYGFHRQFCMWTKIGRGTPDCPGLTLALEPGGSNKGIAYRIPAKNVEQELKIVWNREMIGGSYVPKVVNLHINNKQKKVSVLAIAFVMNRAHENYAGKIALETMAEAIAVAEGPLGKCSDYLFNTVMHLEKLGLTDRRLAELARRVRSLNNKN